MYTGEWEDGLRSGRGQCIYASGEKFDGQWSCNQPLENDYRVQATFVVPLGSDDNGGKLSRRTTVDGGGEYCDGGDDNDDGQEGHRVTSQTELARLNGPKSVIYPSGDKYTGQLVEGRRHGRGVYSERATGNKYEGEWKDDLRHGHGVLSSGAHDFWYDGDWMEDKRTGQGHCTIRGRESYTGRVR